MSKGMDMGMEKAEIVGQLVVVVGFLLQLVLMVGFEVPLVVFVGLVGQLQF